MTIERRQAVLTPQDIELILEAIDQRLENKGCGFNSCFTEEEAVLIKKWVQVMEGAGSWMASLIAKGLLIIVGVVAWLAVTHKLWNYTIGGK